MMFVLARTMLAFAAMPLRKKAERRLGTHAADAAVPAMRGEKKRQIAAPPSALDRPYLDTWIQWRHGR
jgi:hypothetical protein